MSKITKSAKGEQCQVRIPGICNHNPETTVFAHLNGGGMGIKQPDSEGAYACNDCHDILDGRRWAFGYIRPDIYLMHLEGCVRTRKILIEKGLLILK